MEFEKEFQEFPPGSDLEKPISHLVFWWLFADCNFLYCRY